MDLRTHQALHDAELPVCSRRDSSPCHSTHVRIRRERSHRHNINGKVQGRLEIRAVAVVVEVVDRPLSFHPIPTASLLVQHTYIFTDQAPNPSTGYTCILPSIKSVVKAASSCTILPLNRTSIGVRHEKIEIFPAFPYLQEIVQ